MEEKNKATPFQFFKHLAATPCVIKDTSYENKTVGNIDPHYYNTAKAKNGQGHSLCLILPSTIGIPFDVYLGSCENSIDQMVLPLLSFLEKGLLVDCRGERASRKATPRELETFCEDWKLPKGWMRHRMAVNTMTKTRHCTADGLAFEVKKNWGIVQEDR